MRRVLALGLLLAAAGCDLLAGDDPYRELPVVSAVLVAGEPLAPVTLSRTAPIDAPFDPLALRVSGATVGVSLLRADGSLEAFYPYNDQGQGVYVPAEPARVLGGRRYRLAVAVPGRAAPVTAETTVPTAFGVVTPPPDTLVYQAGPGPRVRVTASEVPGRQTIFLFTIRALAPAQFARVPRTGGGPADTDSTWVEIPSPDTYGLTPFAADLVFDRDVAPQDLIVGNSPVLNEGNYEPHGDGTLTLGTPWVAVNYYGPQELLATALDDALVRFLQSRAIQTIPTTISPGEIPNVDSNVENGLGVFGSAAQARVEVFVREP
jgi:hypothetical protein